MGYLIPEVAPGDWTIKVQISIYVPMCPLLEGGGHNNDRLIMLAILDSHIFHNSRTLWPLKIHTNNSYI